MMMSRAGGAVAVAFAALLVSCNADPHQEQDVAEQNSANRYDAGDLEDFLRYLVQYDNSLGESNNDYLYGRNVNGIGGSSLLGRNLNGIGGSSLLGRNLNGIGGSSLLGRNLNGIGGSSLLGRNLNGIGGSSLLGRNLDGIGGSSLLGRNLDGIGGSSLLGRNLNGVGGTTLLGRNARYIDSLGGGNLVRNLDSLGGGNLVRNLDSIGGGNLLKKNLDHIGGPYLIKRTLDSLGGGNLVRNLDSLGGGNLVRNLDSIGGHQARPETAGPLTRPVRETHHSNLPPYVIRRYDYPNPGQYGRTESWPAPAQAEYAGYYADGYPKRNIDDIDRSDLNMFVTRRNFDEIDQTSMPFPYATKRFLHSYHYGSPHMMHDQAEKRLFKDYPMDEIDLSLFPLGSKRSEAYPHHVLG